MNYSSGNHKILNDPVYGFIKIPSGLISEIISFPCFQRLRRIKQLGLTYMVYPGANHNRLQHVLGAMHLMQEAIDVLRSKDNDISDEEEEAVLIAILLHDIGHGPFSHSLEHSIIENITHEEISIMYMNKINEKLNGKLSLAIDIFRNKYHKKYLHQLVSGQLDTDRLDYLNRDSFFTGVTEGVVGSERIIKMLDVVDDELVVEEKGIYSVEKFLIARRLMYWQVYLHKTVVSAEQLLINIMKRAKHLAMKNTDVFATPQLKYFLTNSFDKNYIAENSEEILNNFTLLDDNDIISSIKQWSFHKDFILSELSKMLTNRVLPKTILQKNNFTKAEFDAKKQEISKKMQLTDEQVSYFVISGKLSNKAYSYTDEKIKIKLKTGITSDIQNVSDMLNVPVLSKSDEKHFLTFPKI